MGEHKIVSVSVEKNEFERYELARNNTDLNGASSGEKQSIST
jgi:hypothetical protein